jgi:methylmalonyl-CoA mutase
MENLFDDFNLVSSKQWKQKIQFELDGADYNQTLIWNSPEDIQVKPFYHKDEAVKPFEIKTKASEFKICQNVFVQDVNKSVERALDSINRGAESLRFTIHNPEIDVVKLLEKLPSENIPIYFNFNFLSLDFIKKIDSIASQKGRKIYCNLDPIGNLAREGNWFTAPEKNNFDTLNDISKSTSNLSFVSVDLGLYQNAGANIVQQIGYALAHANEYLNRIPNLKQPIVFQVSVGTNYFFEIAKLRALRLLFNLIAKEYNHDLECMSAILGGADAIAHLPYDVLYHKDNEFGDRIARNQLLILKNEGYFDKVDNPADGSYYIESLTNQLAEKALALFKEIEANGGFLNQLNEGIVKRKIQESADKEQKLFDAEKEILIGINKYSSKNDKMKNNLELYPFVKIKPRKTLITPIIEKRLAEKLEQERLAQE